MPCGVSASRAAPRPGGDVVDWSVLIAARRAEHCLANTCRELHAALRRDGASFEIIIISHIAAGDGYQTPQVAASVAAYYPAIRAEIAPHTSGKGAALKWAVSRARGRVIAFVDADLPFGAEFVLRALREAGTDCSMVVANRRLPSSNLGLRQSLLSVGYRRHLFRKAFNRLVRALLPITCTDTQAGAKAMSREFALDAFDRIMCPGSLFDIELFLAAANAEEGVKELPVTLCPRREQSTVRIARQLVHSLYWLVRIAFRNYRGLYSPVVPAVRTRIKSEVPT